MRGGDVETGGGGVGGEVEVVLGVEGEVGGVVFVHVGADARAHGGGGHGGGEEEVGGGGGEESGWL